MESVRPADSMTSRRTWPLLIAGGLLFLIGPALYSMQVHFKQLWTPWYVPLLASLGVVLMATAALKSGSRWSRITLSVFALACVGEWYMLTVQTKSPEYAGPVRPGGKLPVFSAVLANGTPFTNEDLENKVRSVLVFFRGRW